MLVSQKADEEQNVENLALAWHNYRDFLAVSVYKSNDGGEVGFFTKQGGRSFYKSKKRLAVRATQICWHSKEPVLLIGWDNGKLTLVNPLKAIEEDIVGTDLSEICSVAWNSNSGQALAGDNTGKINSVKIDPLNFTNSKFLKKTLLREETPVSIVYKSVKVKPSSAQASRKLAKQEAFSESDAVLLSALSESQKRQSITEAEQEIFVKDNTERVDLFYVGTTKGAVHSFDGDGNCHKVFQCDNSILQLLDVSESEYLLASTDSMLFYQLTVESKRTIEKIRIKLSGKKEFYKMLLIDHQTIAVCYGEREIRIWDLETNDNALFRLQTEKGYSDKDIVVCLSYSPRKNMISAGTSEGRIARWKRRRDVKDQTLDQQWRLQIGLETDCHIESLDWSPTTAALVVNSITSVTIFRDEGIHVHFDGKYAAVQKSPQIISIVRLIPPLEAQDVNMPLSVKGFRLSSKFLSIWDDQEVHIYEIKDIPNVPIAVSTVSTFACPAKDIAVFNAMVIVLEDTKLDIRTFQGTIRQTINFREIEGPPTMIDINGKYMGVATGNGYLSIFDLSGKDMKQQFQSSQVAKNVPDFDKFVKVCVNSAGNRMSFSCTQKNDEVFEKLFVWDGETDSVGYFSLHQGITDQQLYEAEAVDTLKPGERPKTAAARKIEREQNRFRLPEHSPGTHVFDKIDPRLLVCEAEHFTGDQSKNLILSMYTTTESGVQMHDIQQKSEKAEQLLHLAIPYLYFFKNAENDEEDDLTVERSISRLLLRRTLREFVGIDDTDLPAINAMLDFSFYLCMGQMDNAFKSIKYIKSDSVWDHMARMCVKTRRIDVARVCLGNMRNARAARNLRLSIERGDSVDMQAAQLAIELAMIDEAISIYSSIKRYDMINKIFQTQNKWDDAFKIAEKYDRINLRNTYFNYARYLEYNGALEAAIENYELSGTQKYEVPRALFNSPKILEIYVRRRKDGELQKWWGHYLESIGDIVTARNFYKIAGEYLDVVRLLCIEDHLDEAAAVVNESNNEAAAFHLGRQYENKGEVDKAVVYFTKAHAYASAIRLAKEHEMSDKLANLALQAGGSDLIEAAKYYEDKPGQTDKAVMLYHKAGMVGRALDLAFRTEQHSALDLIVQELDETSDPQVLERAAEFFANNQQNRRSIQLLAYAKNYSKAIKICRDKNVIITEELADLLTPPKGDKSTALSRNELLEEIAKCCIHQGNYHFAAKKFTQAGNKLEAMRSLLKSGDTTKIILFTNTARNKDIYRMAGNYLQTLPWRDDMELMRSIESFYVKADALDSLALFYKSCADVEIDEYRDYDKGFNAINEALNTITKKINKENGTNKADLSLQEELKEKVLNVKRFIDAKGVYLTDPGTCLKEIQAMIEIPGIEDSVRRGDLYGVLILHNAKRSNFKKAYQYIEEALGRRPKIDMKQFLNTQILDQICDDVGKPRITAVASAPAASDEEEENGVDFSHAMRRRMSNNDGYHSDDDGF